MSDTQKTEKSPSPTKVLGDSQQNQLNEGAAAMTSIPETIELNERYRGKEGKEARRAASRDMHRILDDLGRQFSGMSPWFIENALRDYLTQVEVTEKSTPIPNTDVFLDLIDGMEPVESPYLPRCTLVEQLTELPADHYKTFELGCTATLTREGQLTSRVAGEIARLAVRDFLYECEDAGNVSSLATMFESEDA